MTELIIDNRERDLISWLEGKGVEHKVEQLDIGDILIRGVDGASLVVIERKTVADLKASIIDGRSREQKARLLNTGIDRARILFVIEGAITPGVRGISTTNLLGSIINTQFRDNVKVYKTADMNETGLYVMQVFHKFKTDLVTPSGGGGLSSYAETIQIKKKDNMTPDVWFNRQLCLVYQVTDKVAKVIIAEYPTAMDLVKAYTTSDNPKGLLMDLKYPIKNDKVRRVGEKISERIYSMYAGVK